MCKRRKIELWPFGVAANLRRSNRETAPCERVLNALSIVFFDILVVYSAHHRVPVILRFVRFPYAERLVLLLLYDAVIVYGRRVKYGDIYLIHDGSIIGIAAISRI